MKLSLTTNSLLRASVSAAGAGKVRAAVWGNAEVPELLSRQELCRPAGTPLRGCAVPVRWGRAKPAPGRAELCGLGALGEQGPGQRGDRVTWTWLGTRWPLGRWWSLCWLTISYTTVVTEQRQTWHQTPRNYPVLLLSVTTILWKSLPSS